MSNLYLDLLKKTLTHSLWDEPLWESGIDSNNPIKTGINKLLSKTKYRIAEKVNVPEKTGAYWKLQADTMLSIDRLDNLQYCIEDILRKDIQGDFIECGVWRGGACIFMKAVLEYYGVYNRKIYVADSFQGLPKSSVKQEAQNLHECKFLRVSKDEVERNFKKYGMLDDNIIFIEGFFKRSLPKANINKLALLRLDGDLYESTIDSITNLYPKLSVGGYCIVDDYGLSGCKKAIDEYRESNSILSDLITVDESCCYWIKEVLK